MSGRIESRDNALVKRLARLSADRGFRRETGEMVCEGGKMLGEALASGVAVREVLVADGAPTDPALLRAAEAAGARLHACPPALLGRVSNVKTPQGIVFSCARPTATLDALDGARRVLVLEGLQDPGNLGTIMRTADAFALDGLILCEGCVDPTSPKVVRATMGAAFRLPVAAAALEEAAAFLRARGLPLYAAALGADSVPVTRVGLSRAAVLIGNEGRGASARAIALSDRRVIIAMTGHAESLNASVAASIIMYEMSRPDLPREEDAR